MILLKLSWLENWEIFFFFIRENKSTFFFSPQNETLTFRMLQSYSCWAARQQNPLAWALGEDFTLAWGDGARGWESPCQDDTSSGVSPQETIHRRAFNSCSPAAAECRECNTSFCQNPQLNYKACFRLKEPLFTKLDKRNSSNKIK